ncbi:tRNA (adenosine(37)-N6)-threonylcarbamoyltransferase complex ATPase subunit type 1 TsaE [Candidatus Parcubacteria bacterium]|nr:tRNA (adenosine(37)-N6)-threonylcarbamoyltransferase complex ATPase subunit type 1 TsaE [Candidatus Parcubacteria bacterium]
MQAYEIELRGERATRKAGQILGELLRQQPTGKRDFVLALEGELGAGKTTFIRGLAKGLGIRSKITSPSFLVAKRYTIPSARTRRRSFGLRPQDDGKGRVFWHFDFYRLERPTQRDLELLNFHQILSDLHTIVAIEWAERAMHSLPEKRLTLRFTTLNSRARKLIVSE